MGLLTVFKNSQRGTWLSSLCLFSKSVDLHLVDLHLEVGDQKLESIQWSTIFSVKHDGVPIVESAEESVQ